jgi:hypothetical protein
VFVEIELPGGIFGIGIGNTNLAASADATAILNVISTATAKRAATAIIIAVRWLLLFLI